MKSQKTLFSRFVKELNPGTLTWIGLRPERKASMVEVNETVALEDLGLRGDHRCDKIPGSGRQVTLISQEYIEQIAHFTGRTSVHPALLRRNLVVKNINLSALRYQTFTIGEAVFEATTLCHPCSRMEAALGKGGFAAMLGHGGLCAKITRTGKVQVGDTVKLITPQQELF